MRMRPHFPTCLLLAFTLAGCESLLTDARKISGQADGGLADGGLDAGPIAEEDAGLDAGEAQPGPDDIWVRLTVRCIPSTCSLGGRDLIFYAYDGVNDKTGQLDAPDYYHVFENAAFPFSVLLKNTRNTLGVAGNWPATPIAGGAFFDIESGTPVPVANDPQNLNNNFQFQPGVVNEVALVLDALPDIDESWVELTVECMLDECTKTNNLVFYGYDGADDGTFDVPQVIPDYFHTFSQVSFPFTTLLKKSKSMNGAEKEWAAGGSATVGAYYDTDPVDPEMASRFDPQDRRNRINLTAGEIVKVRLTLHETPLAGEVWVHVTIDCAPLACSGDKPLGFYLYDGPIEEVGDADYYHEWEHTVFPFRSLLTHSYTVDAVQHPWTAGQVTGGAFYDMAPGDGYAADSDPRDRDNAYTLEAGTINYLDFYLEVNAGK